MKVRLSARSGSPASAGGYSAETAGATTANPLIHSFIRIAA
jgi:hypothetical protein